jgi:hypothetical protein
MMLAVAFMAVLLAVSPLVPGVKWLEPGDFSSTAEVVYYHTVMFELVMLGLLTVSYVVGLPKRLSLAVSASNVPIMVLSVLGVGLSYPAWASTANNVVQGLRDFWLFVLSLAVLIGLLASPFIDREVKSLARAAWSAYALLVVSMASALIAGFMGLTAAWGEYLNFAGPSWVMSLINNWGGPSTFLGNVITSHSHEMLSAVGGAIVALVAMEVGYSSYRGPARRLVDAGMIVAIFGTISMTVLYIISSYGTYSIPTIATFGPNGVNGLALDDSQTGLIGWGALIVAVGLIGSGVLTSRPMSRRNLLILEIATWVAAIFVLVGIGYPIEFNEAFFGFGVNGTPPTGGPGFMYDDLFMRGHILFAFYLMPVLAGAVASAIALVNSDEKALSAAKVSLYVGLIGIILGADGVLVWMLSNGLGQVLATGLAIVVLTLFIVVYIMVVEGRGRTNNK